METIELERETEQQIDVNFDFLQQSQQERALETAKSFEWVAKETLVVLVETEHSFAEDFQLCGMKMTDWVALATSGCKHKVISFVGEDEILQAAKQYAGDFSYVAVLYNDIPLLKKQTFLDLMDYFAKRKMNVMRLERGFVFRSEYLENAQILLSGMVEKFGEEDFFVVDNAEKGLQEACERTGALVREYTAAPVFMDSNAKCRHQWLIEFAKKPTSPDEFAKILDTALQQINSDYEAKRYKNKTMQQLELVVARDGLFNDWLKSKGKLGGQHKVPRLSNSRQYIEELLKMNE